MTVRKTVLWLLSCPAAATIELPRDLEVICLKCLEKDPRHRYDIGRHPWPTTSVAGSTASRSPPDPSAASLGPGCGRSGTRRWRHWRRRWSWRMVGGVVGITLQWQEAVAQRNNAFIARDAARQARKLARAEGEAEVAREDAAVRAKVPKPLARRR